MTEEQIRQNAKEYALFDNGIDIDCSQYRAYIVGAHSRDEEINQLEKKVSALETVIVTARATISTQEAIIKDLRNPWISVEDRLPDDMQKVIWVRKDGQYFFGHFHNHDNGRLYFVSTEAVTDVTGEWRDRVTHWMPIPELKKGE